MKLNDIYEGWHRQGDMFTAELSDIEAQTGGRPPRCPKCRQPVHVTQDLAVKRDREGDIMYWTGECPRCRQRLEVFNDHEEKKGNVIEEGKTHKDKPSKPRAKHLSDIMKGRKGGAMRDKKKDYVRAKEKQKVHKEVNEANELGGMEPRELYREARDHIREAMNHTNYVLARHFDRGPRWSTPDKDTIVRLSRAASMIDNANHILAAGSADDKEDPMDV